MASQSCANRPTTRSLSAFRSWSPTYSSVMLQPGTSTLVVQVEVGTWDAVAEVLSRYGGSVLESSLSLDAEWRLQEALLRGTTR